MTTEELVKAIVEWCSDNGQAESRFLTPEPEHYVFTFPLFNHIAEKSGIPKEKIAEWFNERQESHERS